MLGYSQSLALGQGLAEAAQGRQEQGAENSTHREGSVVLAIGFGCTRQVISERIGTELKRKEVFLIPSRLERVVDVQEVGKEFLGRTSSITGLSILERAALGAPHVCGIKLQREGAMRPHSHVTKGIGGAFPKR